MKALAIVALIFAALSLFIPVLGVFLAMLCSLFALISFRSQPTLSGITFGLNIINTMFLSPSIMLSDVVTSGALDLDIVDEASKTDAGEVYFFYVGFHIVLFVVAVMWRLIRGAPETASTQAAGDA